MFSCYFCCHSLCGIVCFFPLSLLKQFPQIITTPVNTGVVGAWIPLSKIRQKLIRSWALLWGTRCLEDSEAVFRDSNSSGLRDGGVSLIARITNNGKCCLSLVFAFGHWRRSRTKSHDWCSSTTSAHLFQENQIQMSLNYFMYTLTHILDTFPRNGQRLVDRTERFTICQRGGWQWKGLHHLLDHDIHLLHPSRPRRHWNILLFHREFEGIPMQLILEPLICTSDNTNEDDNPRICTFFRSSAMYAR